MSKGWSGVARWYPRKKTGKRNRRGALSRKGSRQPSSGIRFGYRRCAGHAAAAMSLAEAKPEDPSLNPSLKKVNQPIRLLLCPSHWLSDYAPSSSFSWKTGCSQQYSLTPNREGGRHLSELLRHLTHSEIVKDFGSRFRTLVYSKPSAERSETPWLYSYRWTLVGTSHKSLQAILGNAESYEEYNWHTVWYPYLIFSLSSMTCFKILDSSHHAPTVFFPLG